MTGTGPLPEHHIPGPVHVPPTSDAGGGGTGVVTGSGGETSGQVRGWKWPWGRGRGSRGGESHDPGQGHPMNGTPVWENNPEIKAAEANRAAEEANIQKEAEQYKNMGGFPVQSASEDPASTAMGDVKPESHDTGPDIFKGR